MHELAVTQNILNIALEKAKAVPASKVRVVNVVVGELSGAVPDCIQFYFEFLSKDTPAEGAALNCTSVPARLRCRQCRNEFHPEDIPWVCPGCGGISVEVLGGQELYVDSLEVD